MLSTGGYGVDVVLVGPHRARVAPAGDPGRPGPGQALVEVDCVSLCGSDYRLYQGTYGGPRSYPIRFGHEWAGRVTGAHPDCADLLGAPVTGDCSRWCGQCDMCAVDRNLCRRIEKFGLTRDGFSTRRRLVEARYLYADPYPLPPRLRALAEVFAVALHGLERVLESRRGPGELLVVGGGPLGVASYLIATHHFGVAGATIMEADPRKAEVLRQRLPGVRLLPPPEPERIAAARSYRATAALARYPVVAECAGSAAGWNTALALADHAGEVLCFGLDPTGEIRRDLLVAKRLTVHGAIGGTGAFPGALAFLHRHRAAAAALLTHAYPAGDVAGAFERAGADPGRIKTQVLFERRCDRDA